MNNNMTSNNMSNEEVIDILKGMVFNSFDRTTPKEREALDFAIKSLEERPRCWTPCPNKKEKPQGDCNNCDFRKFSEKFVDTFVDLMTKNDITSVEQLSEILKGVENMRKPNCVTCDHFGKCESCEKGEEE